MESGGIEGLVAQLQEALPGFTALDRDLVLGDVTVELVGRTGDNRLVLVRRVESVDAEAMTGLLDLLSTARAQAALLARHVGAGVEASAPQVVLVTEEMDERAARRLAALDTDAVRVLEVREIASRRARSTFLVTHNEQADGPSTQAVDERLADLDHAVRRRVAVLVERLSRVDDELTLATTDDGLEWRWRGRPVCAILADGPAARATVAGQETRTLEDDEVLETVVDLAIARWLGAAEEAEGIGSLEVRPPAPRPLVGPEELDALRD